MECNKVKLRMPAFKDLSYRKQLLADSKTMSYNKGFDEFTGYDKETGCIDFDESSWEDWFSKWVDNMPNRYYAYVEKVDENIPIGEVALRYEDEKNAYSVSVVIEAKHRSKGYSEQALRLLMDVAFNKLNAEKVFDDFPNSRVSAEKVFAKVGFKRISDDIVELTKRNYLNSMNSKTK